MSWMKLIAAVLVICFALVSCGTVQYSESQKARLGRIPTMGYLGGVCSGIAYFTATPVWLVRAAFIVVSFIGLGVVIYVVLWIFMPKYDQVPPDYKARTSP